MIGTPSQHPPQDGRRLPLDVAADERVLMPFVGPVAEERGAAGHRAHEGEGMEALGLQVLRIRRGQAPHRLRVGAIPRVALSASEQDLDGL
jgi:hypothetical protein